MAKLYLCSIGVEPHIALFMLITITVLTRSF